MDNTVQMKILSPLDTPEEVGPLIEAGAGEFYCGVLEESWYNPYPVISINRRPAGKGHFRNFEELKKAVILTDRHNVPLFFTINEHYYTREQLPLVKDYIQKAVDLGVRALIISDYGLMTTFPDLTTQVDIHISTGGTVFNWRAACFYRDLGASRITFPRHLTLKEMKKVSEHSHGLETTAFVFNSRCINVDGFCTFQHGLSGKQTPQFYRNACMLPYEIAPIPLKHDMGEKEISVDSSLINRQRVWETIHLDDYPCGACALYEFKQMMLTSIKIVGRGNTTERKKTDITFFQTLLNHLYNDKPPKSEFRRFARTLYNKTYQRSCRPFMCHYPSVMKGSNLHI
jgi:collagenase-like PrtC family protease